MPTTKTMSQEELRQIILRHLRAIAPEADVSTLRPHDDIRETLEVDSFDFLNFLIAINTELGISIPEQDYGQVNTVDRLTRYLMAQMTP
jgi:acyl carrier protein